MLHEASDGEFNWRSNILYCIHHYVIRIRRSDSRQDLQRALGVLAYAKAFRGICLVRDKRRLGVRLPVFQDEAVKDSIISRLEEQAAAHEEVTRRRAEAVGVSAAYRTLFFTAYIGVLTILSAVLAPYFEENKTEVIRMGKSITDNILLVILCLFTSFPAIWILTSWRFFSEGFYNGNILYSKDVVTLALLHRKVVKAASALLSISLILGVILLLWSRF